MCLRPVACRACPCLLLQPEFIAQLTMVGDRVRRGSFCVIRVPPATAIAIQGDFKAGESTKKFSFLEDLVGRWLGSQRDWDVIGVPCLRCLGAPAIPKNVTKHCQNRGRVQKTKFFAMGLCPVESKTSRKSLNLVEIGTPF